MKICLFLDVDGVLNQYRISERIRRCQNSKIGRSKCFNPYPKKVKRLSSIINKYNIDVYIFSAWRKEELEKLVHFKLLGDTRKSIEAVNSIAKSYDYSILIDDEYSALIKRYGTPEVDKFFQPNYEFGLCKKDFRLLKLYLKGLK